MDDASAALPEELQRATEKHAKRQKQIAKQEGYAATDGGHAIAANWLPELAEGIAVELANTKPAPAHARLVEVIRKLKPEILALCCMTGALQAVGQKNKTCAAVMRGIGELIHGECLAAGLLEHDPGLLRRIEQRAKNRPTRHAQKYARTQAEQAGYQTDEWNSVLIVRAGEWGLDCLLKLIPGVFVVEEEEEIKPNVQRGDGKRGVKYTERYLTLTEAAQEFAAQALTDIIARNPVWLPIPNAPPPWRGWQSGGTADRRLRLSIMQTRHKQTEKEVTAAIASGAMRPAIDALNALQSVPWKINRRVLEVIKRCVADKIKTPGLPADRPVPLPEELGAVEWSALDEQEQKARNHKRREAEKAERQRKSDKTLMDEALRMAKRLASYGRFWTPMRFDWRGRVNTVPSFKFQREDYVRGLFLFADGEPIGEEGIYWLKVHVANRGDFNKISKRPFTERVAWVDQNLEDIKRTAADPMAHHGWWTEAGEPFQFLAACMELDAALAEGPSYISTLPIAFDGSCSGLQHLCAMTRADEGPLVNLTAQPQPQDFYQTVADQVRKRIESETSEDDRHARDMWLAYEITRATVKSNVMTYAYGSKPYGMAEQIRDALMSKLTLAWLNGERETHPFGDDDRGYGASWYLAKRVYAVIEEILYKPAEAMRFLQDTTRKVTRENRVLRWTTPVGIPWSNRYHVKKAMQIKLWLRSRGISWKTIENRYGSELDAIKAANSVAPNLVHALDAAHLLRTVNACVAEGITNIATVHDSFGCLPSRAGRFRQIIREEFVRMYQEHDPLQEVLDQACADLAGTESFNRLPERIPGKGTLKIEGVLDAEYAFA